MKKGGCLIILSTIIVLVIMMIRFKEGVDKQIISENENIEKIWNKIELKIIDKNRILKSNSSLHLDSLINESSKLLNQYNECNLDIVENEYFINKKVLEYKDLKFSGLDSVYNNLNLLIDNYNSTSRLYNSKYMRYPERYFFKKMNFKNKEFFFLKYGEHNVNPKKKKQDILNSFGI